MKKYYVLELGGGTYWYKDSELSICHCEHGPSIRLDTGHSEWLINGVRHREDGPAIVYSDGRKEWWLNGHRVSEDEHQRRTQPVAEMTVAEIEKLLGKRIKVVK